MFFRNSLKSMPKSAGLVFWLCAALVISGCSLIKDEILDNGEVNSTVRLLTRLGTEGGIGLADTTTGTGTVPQRYSTFYSNKVDQFIRDAGSGSQRAILNNITPTYTGTTTLTDSNQNNATRRNGTLNVLVGAAAHTSQVTAFTDSSGASEAVFVGAPTASSSGGGTQALGTAPVYAVGRQGGSETGSHLIIAAGERLSGTIGTGTYVYTGVLATALHTNFGSIAVGNVRLEMNVGTQVRSVDVSGSTTHGSIDYDVSTGFAFDANTGRFSIDSSDKGAASDSNGFKRAGASSAVHFELLGLFSGVSGQAVTGIFTTTGTTATEYAGGFVASGTADLKLVDGDRGSTSTATALVARGVYGIGSASAATAAFVLPQGSTVFVNANHPSQSVRENALVGSLETITGDFSSLALPAVADRTGVADLDADLAISAKVGTISHNSATLNTAVYQDRGGVARLVLVEGANRLIAAGGTALSNPPQSGAYVWEGVYLIAPAAALTSTTQGRFRLETTFSASDSVTFSFTGATRATGVAISGSRLSAAGSVTKATGVFSSSASGFDLDLAETLNIDGKLEGTLHGDGATAVSGAFVTTDTGTRYAGGFVGGAPQPVVVSRTLTGTNAAQTNAFGTASATIGSATEASRFVFVTKNANAVRDEANVPATAQRQASLFESLDIGGAFSGDTTVGPVRQRTGGSYSYDGATAALDLYDAGSGIARLFVVNASARSVAASPVAYTVAARTGTLANGDYTWIGTHVSGTQRGTFLATANIQGATADLTYTTTGASPPFTVAGTAQITAATGAIANKTGSNITYTPSGGSAVNLVFVGEVGGASGAAIAGLFAVDAASGVAGGFLAGLLADNNIATTATLEGDSVSGAGVASGIWSNTTTGQTSRITVLASQINQLVTSTNAAPVPPATTRTGAVNALLEINPTSISTANAAKNVGPITFTSGTGAVSAAGATNAITLYTDTYTGARLYLVGLTTDMAVGQGPQATSIPTTGSVTYDGVIVAGTRANFADNTAHDQGEFEMTINFGSSPTFTFATTNLATAMTTTSGGTGTLSIANGGFQSSAGLNYGTAAATLYGQLHGAQARGLSGVWHVNGANPASVGAFLGSNYPYPSSTYTLSTQTVTLPNSITVKYGLALGERTRTATHTTTPANSVKSDIVFISSTVATDVSTSSASNQAWLTSALEATLADDSTRADGTGAAQTYTKGRTATGIIAYETTRGGSNTRMYIVDNGDRDRLLVAGPEYTSKSHLTTVAGGANDAARTLNYTGRVILPARQIGLYNNTSLPIVGFDATLEMTAGTAPDPATGAFELISDIYSTGGSNRTILVITASLDIETGRLTSSDGIEFRSGNTGSLDNVASVRGNSEVFSSHGFAGQVYGSEAQSIGGVFWGIRPDGQAAGWFGLATDSDKVFAGGFIGTKNP